MPNINICIYALNKPSYQFQALFLEYAPMTKKSSQCLLLKLNGNLEQGKFSFSKYMNQIFNFLKTRPYKEPKKEEIQDFR